MSFGLFTFQNVAADALNEAVARWIRAGQDLGRGPSDVEGNPIPLFAHLTAITGAGKTPVLAKVIGRVGPAVVIWTSQRSVVIDQTVGKLRTVYRHFLPDETTIIGEKPTQEEWHALMENDAGLVIWCLTVASWNEPEPGAKGTAEARLNIHRPAPDWAGERSPWDQLGDLEARRRPLWVVYDEGHGQTDVQLDQLLDLDPVGIIAASGTPSFSKKINALLEFLSSSKTWGPIAEAAMVDVPTQKVAEAGLLKSAIEMVDLNTDAESKIVAAVEQLRKLDEQAIENGYGLRPRAIYVTEESDRATGEPRPVTIWKVLTERCGVPPTEIAIATSTREIPQDAERVTDLAQLRPRHRHLIFNKKFQEGWDDPEAYVAYFDGETKSTTRIKQIIGRVIRQPNAKAFAGAMDLNTAFLYMSAPDARFAAIVDGIRHHLLEEYGADEAGEPRVKLSRSSEKEKPTTIRADAPVLSLPVHVIQASGLESLFDKLGSAGQRPFPPADLAAPGSATRMTFKLTETQKQISEQILFIGQHIQERNRNYFRDRVQALSREGFERLPVTALAGPMWDQSSAIHSVAHDEIARLATAYVDEFEQRATYTRNPDPQSGTWHPQSLSSWRPATLAYSRSLHSAYPDAPSFLNNDERAMAVALDAVNDGWWMRNPPTRALGGYAIPMPVQVAGSQSFYPDFLWWVDDGAWAIDTTGVHILEPKVRGKLLGLDEPRIALVTRGKVALSLDTLEDKAGWTLLLPTVAGPRRTNFVDIPTLLAALRSTVKA